MVVGFRDFVSLFFVILLFGVGGKCVYRGLVEFLLWVV